MRKYLFPAIIVIGLIAFAAIIWFAGPFLGFGSVFPLEDEWVRILIIVVVCGGIGLYYLIRMLLRRRAAKKLEEGLINSGESGSDAGVLSERMQTALTTLKASTGKSNYLYTLPWYIIIGPPGAGKTTALLKSGLKFPLMGPGDTEAIAGAGGTRYCDWWFTDEAVIVDTAGRYTTQDSDQKADNQSWLSFLSLLKRNRPKQPINGIIVAISLQDVMTMTKSELAAHSAAIRKRLLEVHQQLKIDFPVYALFTKADLIAGFNEYFGNFTESRRRKVWGATFQTEDRRKNMIASVPVEYDALVKRLTEELNDRLQEEPDQISRIAIFGFPAQFAMLKENVYEFLRQIFEPNRYQVNANLRGFYFSSGTQEGTPIDQVLGAMDRSFGGNQGMQLSGLGKSYFLHDLITEVIFNETGWVSLDMGAIRRSAVFRYGAMAVVGLATLLLLGAWGWSYFNNDTLIDTTDQFIASYRVNANAQINQTEVSDIDIDEVLPALEQLRSMPVGFEQRGVGTPLGETFGLSQRDRLSSAAEFAYRKGLERMLRSRLIIRLEQQIEASINDPLAEYTALKVYMMLGGVAPESDDEFVVAFLKQDWEDNLFRGANNRALRDSLEKHVRAMLELDRGQRPEFELNGLMLDAAQRTLTRLSVAEQAYAYLKSLTPRVALEEFNVQARSGPESTKVFETVDGTPFEELVVPALFTYRGFHEHFLAELAGVAVQLASETWVRGEVGQQVVNEQAFAQLGPQLLRLYATDFVDTWNGVLRNIKLKTMPGESNVALSVLANPASSPLKALVEGLVEETQLTREPPADDTLVGGAAADAKALADAAALTQARLQNQVTGLQRIGIDLALAKSSGRPGETAAGVPGENIEAQFQDFAVLVDGEPDPISAVLENFNTVVRGLLVAAQNPNQAAAATEQNSLALANLKLSASRFPEELRRMILGAVDDLEGEAAGTTLAQLNQALASEVTRICESLIDNRFPFEEGSSREVQMADFSRLFAPDGVVDRFFKTNLIGFADLSGEIWTWNDSALGRELSNTTLREFQRAAEIRDAFFPPGAQQPQVTITVSQTSLNPAAEIAILDINGTVIQTQQLGNTPQVVQWPGPGGGAVTITILPELIGRESTVSVPGPWALLKVLNRNTIRRSGDTLSVRIVVGGRDVNYNFQIGTALNPFSLPALSDFSCPTGL